MHSWGFALREGCSLKPKKGNVETKGKKASFKEYFLTLTFITYHFLLFFFFFAFFFFSLFFQPIKVRCTQTHTHGKSHKGARARCQKWVVAY